MFVTKTGSCPRNDILDSWKSSKRSFGRRLKLGESGGLETGVRLAVGLLGTAYRNEVRCRWRNSRKHFILHLTFINSLDRPFRSCPKWLFCGMR